MTHPHLAGHGGIRSILDDMKLLSTEAEGVNEAIAEDKRAEFVNESGRVGALLGLKSSERPGINRDSTGRHKSRIAPCKQQAQQLYAPRLPQLCCNCCHSSRQRILPHSRTWTIAFFAASADPPCVDREHVQPLGISTCQPADTCTGLLWHSEARESFIGLQRL